MVFAGVPAVFPTSGMPAEVLRHIQGRVPANWCGDGQNSLSVWLGQILEEPREVYERMEVPSGF